MSRVKQPLIHEKGWGTETLINNSDGYCQKILTFKKGSVASYHFHKNKTESWYLQSGRVAVRFLDYFTGKTQIEEMTPGSVVLIPRELAHQVSAIEDSVIFEASTPHEDSDTYRIAPGDSQK